MRGRSSENRGTGKERLHVPFSRPKPIKRAIRKLLTQVLMRLDGKNEAERFRNEASVYTLEKEKGGYRTDFYPFRSERGP